MKFLKSSLWASGIAAICFSSTVLATCAAELNLALHEPADRTVIANTLILVKIDSKVSMH